MSLHDALLAVQMSGEKFTPDTEQLEALNSGITAEKRQLYDQAAASPFANAVIISASEFASLDISSYPAGTIFAAYTE